MSVRGPFSGTSSIVTAISFSCVTVSREACARTIGDAQNNNRSTPHVMVIIIDRGDDW
jgi:hypothetical protein